MEIKELLQSQLTQSSPSTLTKPTSSLSTATSVWATLKPFVNGGLAGMLQFSPHCAGLAFTHFPLRFLKTMAVGSPPAADLYKRFIEMHGFVAKSLPALILVESTYATARFGLFEILTKKVEESANDGRPLTLNQKLAVPYPPELWEP